MLSGHTSPGRRQGLAYWQEGKAEGDPSGRAAIIYLIIHSFSIIIVSTSMQSPSRRPLAALPLPLWTGLV